MLLNALPFRLSLLQISPCSPLSLALFAFLILQCLSSLWDYKLWKDKNLWILVSAMSPRALSQCRTYRRCSRYACLVAEWRTEGEFGVAGESKPSFLSVIPDNFALVWVLAHPHIANLFFLFFDHTHVMWGLSSPTRDRTCAPCIGSTESQPLHHQEAPGCSFWWG